MSALADDRDDGRPPPSDAAGAAMVILVHFVAGGDRAWSAIGGGATIHDAVDYARASCPPGIAWRVAGWDELYGT